MSCEKTKYTVSGVLLGFVILFFVLIRFYLVEGYTSNSIDLGVVSDESVSVKSPTTKKDLLLLGDFFEDDKIVAESVYVELRDKSGFYELFSKNSQVARPLASLTKIMTALIALDNSELTDAVVISGDAISQEGDQGLRVGEEWLLDDAIKFMMQSSSNDMAYAVQESISDTLNRRNGNMSLVLNSFVQEMNKKSISLGLKNSFFVDSVGFDLSNSLSGSFGTSEDVAKLLWHSYDTYPGLAKGSIIEEDTLFSGGNPISIKNTNPILREYPEIVLSKTGFTDLAGGNLALVLEAPPGEVVVVIMGSTFSGRFNDARLIIDAVRVWSEDNR